MNDTIDRHLANKLAKALTEIPAAYSRLALFRLPGFHPDIGSRQRHGTDNTRAPVVVTVLDLTDTRTKPDADLYREDYELDKLAGQRREGVPRILRRWATRCDGEMWDSGIDHEPLNDTPAPDVDAECAWLQQHHDWISEQSWLNEIADDLTGLLRDIHAIVGAEKPPKYTCLKPGCGWQVQPRAGHNGSEDAYYACTGCGAAWSGIEYRRELHRIAERRKPKTLKEIAELTNVSLKTLRRYRELGYLQVKARSGKAELFDLEAVALATMNLRYKHQVAVKVR